MRIYDQDVFEEIFSGNTSHFEFSEHRVKPVRPKTEVDDVPQPLAPHERFLLSSPESRLVEKYEGGLTGNYLTALMLFGRGTLVAEKFGDWSDRPAKSITSGLSEEAERAVGEAFAAYREAEQIVGAYPLAHQDEADRLRKEHRDAKDAANVKFGVGVESYLTGDDAEAVAHNARLDDKRKKVVETTSEITAQLDAANKLHEAAYEAWLNAMVRQLLQPAPAQSPATEKPVQRAAAQDAAILCEIQKQGFDPLALPKNPAGKPGPKAAIRTALSSNSLFTGGTVFDKAWERLTANADIVIQG